MGTFNVRMRISLVPQFESGRSSVPWTITFDPFAKRSLQTIPDDLSERFNGFCQENMDGP